jgi:hypothetical protein
MSKHLAAIFICTSSLLGSCQSESEKILQDRIQNQEFDFSKLALGYDNISYDLQDGIQYGLIELQDGEHVKFWFLSHHRTPDKGGTIYEYPNGEKEFSAGYHCCEIQFPGNGSGSARPFRNVEEFRGFVNNTNGTSP